mgnify:CR=1 FL=1
MIFLINSEIKGGRKETVIEKYCEGSAISAKWNKERNTKVERMNFNLEKISFLKSFKVARCDGFLFFFSFVLFDTNKWIIRKE